MSGSGKCRDEEAYEVKPVIAEAEAALNAGNPLPRYDRENETFLSYWERVILYFRPLKHVSDADKVSKLCLSLDADVFHRLRENVSPISVVDATFEQCITALKEMYVPPSNIAERYEFNIYKRQPGQSVADFITNITRLSMTCKFGQFLDHALRDKIVCGIADEAMTHELLQEDETLTFEEAATIVLDMENNKSTVKLESAAASSSVAVNPVLAVEQNSTGHEFVQNDAKCSSRNRTMSPHKNEGQGEPSSLRSVVSTSSSAVSASCEESAIACAFEKFSDQYVLFQLQEQGSECKLTGRTIEYCSNKSAGNTLKEQIRRILVNELVTQNFERILAEIVDLPITTEGDLKELLNQIIETALNEDDWGLELYAQLCGRLQKKMLRKDSGEGWSESSFRKLFLNQCQEGFEDLKKHNLGILRRQEEIDEMTDSANKNEREMLLEEEKRKIRRKSVNLVGLIAEIYRLNMLTHNIMNGCVTFLMSEFNEEPTEESFKCLHKLLTTTGKDLEKESRYVESFMKEFKEYFAQIRTFAQKTPYFVVPSYVRDLIREVIDVRNRLGDPFRTVDSVRTSGTANYTSSS